MQIYFLKNKQITHLIRKNNNVKTINEAQYEIDVTFMNQNISGYVYTTLIRSLHTKNA